MEFTKDQPALDVRHYSQIPRALFGTFYEDVKQLCGFDPESVEPPFDIEAYKARVFARYDADANDLAVTLDGIDADWPATTATSYL